MSIISELIDNDFSNKELNFDELKSSTLYEIVVDKNPSSTIYNSIVGVIGMKVNNYFVVLYDKDANNRHGSWVGGVLDVSVKDGLAGFVPFIGKIQLYNNLLNKEE